jgi:hypothetical protein
MLRKLIIAGATLAALTAPALSAQGWYVIRNLAGDACFAAPRAAELGEEKVSGPFGSRANALQALSASGDCHPLTYEQK